MGWIGFDDAVRPDSRSVVAAIGDAGVRVVMVTGDNPIAARAVADEVGIPASLCPAEDLRGDLGALATDRMSVSREIRRVEGRGRREP